jgi:F420-dependent oxidoreductase-like protein
MANKHPLRFGIQTGQQNLEWTDLLGLWQAADEWGYDSMWIFDHLYPIYSDPNGPCMEGWTTLAALAQATSKTRIGHLVNGNTYRHPSLTAKSAATLDIISEGRLNLGLGAGWFELEHQSLGFDFKTTLGRLAALDEACSIIKGMLAGDKVTLAGEHYQVNEAQCRPLPIQDGGPPLMIGGVGRKVLLKIAAKWADMWNAPGSPEVMADLISVIRRHGDEVGRDTDEIEKTVMLPLCYTPDTELQELVVSLLAGAFELSPEESRARAMIGQKQECLDKVAAYEAAGVTHFIFMLIAPFDRDQIEGFAEEVIPAVRPA